MGREEPFELPHLVGAEAGEEAVEARLPEAEDGDL
jgi:hypothetical protein